VLNAEITPAQAAEWENFDIKAWADSGSSRQASGSPF
jgi:hypothetical protein